MIGIGLRVYSNKKIFYAIIEETDDSYNFLTVDTINVPLAMEEPERLNYIRNTIIDIIAEYQIDNALVRVKESLYNVGKRDIERFYIEGVLLESLAGSTVSKYKLGQIATIAMLLEIERKNFKKFADNELEFENIPNEIIWSSISKEERESILACHASLKL
ncbi:MULTISPECIES: hypothetical protein [Flavobacteriaceae]|uniref:hypothetical protein n=1 Tax=Flavobacteriaceae TaxID=49546 RepID=UPI001490E59F|nr:MULTISPECIES: hypothetical protein [Allomuricauda]MDC6365359.1 hypothetical protein [Muricauda sp. AC10]